LAKMANEFSPGHIGGGLVFGLKAISAPVSFVSIL
jgi:hypothetical protein